MLRPAAAVYGGLLSVLFAAATAPAAAQTPPVESPRPAAQPAPATPAPTTPAPATPAPRPRPRPAAPQSTAANLTMTVRVTDATGSPLVGAKVTASGPVVRASTTDASGMVRFLAMRGGNYRLRFESDTTITLERDVVLRAGGEPVDVSLSPAPPPPPPPPAPEPPANSIAARGPLQAPQPRTVAIPDFVERNQIGSREPAKTSQVACGATSTTNLVQIREPLKEQSHPDADVLLYVVGGEGLLILPIADVPLAAGTFSLVPRGTTDTLQRRGRSGLIVLMSITDTPCPAK